MKRLRVPLVAGMAAVLLAAVVPTAAGAAVRFKSRNNYAIASGSIVRAGTDTSGRALYRVIGSLLDTHAHRSSSYAYLRYYHTRSHRWVNFRIGYVPNGRKRALNRTSFSGKLSTVTVTVCTRRHGWTCGNPSP